MKQQNETCETAEGGSQDGNRTGNRKADGNGRENMLPKIESE